MRIFIFLSFLLVANLSFAGVHLITNKGYENWSNKKRETIYNALLNYAWPSGAIIREAVINTRSLNLYSDLLAEKPFQEAKYIKNLLEKEKGFDDISILEIPSIFWNLSIVDYALTSQENYDSLSKYVMEGESPKRTNETIKLYFDMAHYIKGKYFSNFEIKINEWPEKNSFKTKLRESAIELMRDIASESSFKTNKIIRRKPVMTWLGDFINEYKNFLSTGDSLILRTLDYEVDQIYKNQGQLIRGTNAVQINWENIQHDVLDFPILAEAKGTTPNFLRGSKNLSFAFDLLDGYLFDGMGGSTTSACPFTYYRPEQTNFIPKNQFRVYAIGINKTKDYLTSTERLFYYIPKYLLNESILADGEEFHPRILSRNLDLLGLLSTPAKATTFSANDEFNSENFSSLKSELEKVAGFVNFHSLTENINEEIILYLAREISNLPNRLASIERHRSIIQNKIDDCIATLADCSELKNKLISCDKKLEKIAEANNNIKGLKFDVDKTDINMVTGNEIKRLLNINDFHALYLHHLFNLWLLTHDSTILAIGPKIIHSFDNLGKNDIALTNLETINELFMKKIFRGASQ